MSQDSTTIISEFVSVNSEELLSKVIKIFKKNRELLIFDEKGVFLGYLTQRHISKQSRINPDTKVSNLIKEVQTVHKDTPLDVVARAILSVKVNSVPVEENGKIIGVLRDIDVIRTSGELFKGKYVKELMTQNPISVSDDTTVAKVIAVARTNNLTRIPVVNQSNKLVGIVSPQDISDLIISEFPEQTEGDRKGSKSDTLSLTVNNVMTPNVVICKSDDLVLSAISKLFQTNHKALIVTDEKEHPVGIITTTDLLETVSIPPKTEGYYVRVLGDVDDEDMDQVIDLGAELVKRFANIIGSSGQLSIHAKAIPKKKFRGFVLYQIRMRISADTGNTYVSKSEGYGVFSALAVAIDRIEREIISQRELKIEHSQTGSERYLLDELDEMLDNL